LANCIYKSSESRNGKERGPLTEQKELSIGHPKMLDKSSYFQGEGARDVFEREIDFGALESNVRGMAREKKETGKK